MSLPLEKLIQQSLGDLDTLTPEKIQELIQEALQTFLALKEKVHSKDAKEREEAFEIARSLKETLLSQADELAKVANIDPAQLSVLAENREIFSAEIWTQLSSAKKELESFRNRPSLPKQSSTHVKKKKTVWLPG